MKLHLFAFLIAALFFCGKPIDLLFSGSVHTAELDPVKKVSVSLVDLETGETVLKQKTNSNGEFQLKIPLGNTYKLVFEKEGHTTQQVHVNCSEYRIVEHGYQFNRFRIVLPPDNDQSEEVQDNEFMAYVFFNPESGYFKYTKRPVGD